MRNDGVKVNTLGYFWDLKAQVAFTTYSLPRVTYSINFF